MHLRTKTVIFYISQILVISLLLATGMPARAGEMPPQIPLQPVASQIVAAKCSVNSCWTASK
jgi:hypothetical protein